MKKMFALLMSSLATFSCLTLHLASADVQAPYSYLCNQDPKIVGASITVTISAYPDSNGDFTATVETFLTTYPPQQDLQTYTVTRQDSNDSDAVTFESANLNLKISERRTNKGNLGKVLISQLRLTDEQGHVVREQAMYCQQGNGPGLPGVSGSN